MSMAAYERLLNTNVGSALLLDDAQALVRVVGERYPGRCLELGMANGVSSLALLEAMSPTGKLISIDRTSQVSGMVKGYVKSKKLA